MVSASARVVGVTVTMGNTIVTVQAPAAPGIMALSEAKARAAALRAAARALEVAAQEVAQEQS